MPLHGSSHAFLNQRIDQIGADDILPEPLLLQQLQVLQGRAGIRQVLEVGRSRPVLEVVEVCDKGGVREQLLGGEMVQVEGVSKSLNELSRACQRCIAS